MVRTETVRARISPELKSRAERIFSNLGISPSQAIVIFYKQVELHNGLPFEVKIPTRHVIDVNSVSRDEFDAELEKGYRSALSGSGSAVAESRASFRARHGL